MCNTSSHASDHWCLIWKESIQNCRSYRANTACGMDGWGETNIHPQQLHCTCIIKASLGWVTSPAGWPQFYSEFQPKKKGKMHVWWRFGDPSSDLWQIFMLTSQIFRNSWWKRSKWKKKGQGLSISFSIPAKSSMSRLMLSWTLVISAFICNKWSSGPMQDFLNSET